MVCSAVGVEGLVSFRVFEGFKEPRSPRGLGLGVFKE